MSTVTRGALLIFSPPSSVPVIDASVDKTRVGGVISFVGVAKIETERVMDWSPRYHRRQRSSFDCGGGLDFLKGKKIKKSEKLSFQYVDFST